MVCACSGMGWESLGPPQGNPIPCCHRAIPSQSAPRDSHPMPPQGNPIPVCPIGMAFHSMPPQGHPIPVHPKGLPSHATTRDSEHPMALQGNPIPCRHKHIPSQSTPRDSHLMMPHRHGIPSHPSLPHGTAIPCCHTHSMPPHIMKKGIGFLWLYISFCV